MFGGEILDNLVKGAANFSVSTTNHKITVPTGVRWLFFGGRVNRSANATLVIRLYESGDEVILQLQDDAAATGATNYPNTDKAEMTVPGMPIPLKAGDYINIVFGAAQGATASCSAIVLEVPA